MASGSVQIAVAHSRLWALWEDTAALRLGHVEVRVVLLQVRRVLGQGSRPRRPEDAVLGVQLSLPQRAHGAALCQRGWQVR
eukprot:CAMPEP_0119392534 /NCGR_PEP_ID=MMETSP1334-20130426/121590_1 /TAXON_ID=127549 /ORGANISM="Calcidiscus leptoporus, Strain RCC1130" /LENGTH=80 /DNA_ID=CAMNT_0007415405 /DNA_START=181 /DNA_END=421 /DNA_ORIENTATION=+